VDPTFFNERTEQALKGWAADKGVVLSELQRIFDGVRPTPSRCVSPVPGQAPTIFFGGLRAVPFWDKAGFAWALKVEAAADRIRADYESSRALGAGTGQYESFRTDSGAWSVKYITCIGRCDPRAEERFPTTVETLRSVPGALSCGMTYFSTITPRTHILPHSGFTNAHLRCHLTLSTSDGCRIRVGEDTRTWVDGELLIFDDTYEHEVWNDSPNERAVLLFDMFHPDLSAAECEALSFLASVWRRSIMTRGLTSGQMAA
jgi:aspartyl/asparaginyl beta-hydroxylase (cupin superfamily)